MLEKILHKKKVFALIIRKKYRKKKGISFFSSKKDNQQIGYMSHKKNHIIYPHLHKRRDARIFFTTEVIIILKGKLRVDFYDRKKNYLFSKILSSNDIIYLIQGAHGFKVLKPTEMIEIKQGPYVQSKDKIKFLNVSEKKIKIKN